MEKPSDELQRGQSIGRFTIEEKLGAGGMGVVYAAHDSELRRRVALKLLHPRSGQTEDDLLREAQHLARLNHPNVVTVYEANVTHGRVWISMEYVEGNTLAAWHRQRAHSWEEVLAVMLPVFSGGVDRIHLAAATGSTLGSKSRPGDRDEVDPRRSQ
ncbi:protein kinase [Nannocystis sp.]|uniref:serine/threonine protein kinase n=1 Tax=Nannocystis sp. TaxID=1962667 RepID=UPI0025D28630|nr:protein kinase [Nannocystis sp.]